MQTSKNLFYGNSIDAAIAGLIAEAQEVGDIVESEFNGVTLRVAGDSDASLILREWERGMLREGFSAGPYPKDLTDEDRAEDIRLAEERESRHAASAKAYRDRQAAKAELADAEIAGIELELSDADGWNRTVAANHDPYGSAGVAYAKRWALLMQARMADGTPLKEIADKASRDADVEGITGFMYGCAVSILIQVWKHGEALRRWYNKSTQIGTEGDKANETGWVLNPALLNIGA